MALRACGRPRRRAGALARRARRARPRGAASARLLRSRGGGAGCACACMLGVVADALELEHARWCIRSRARTAARSPAVPEAPLAEAPARRLSLRARHSRPGTARRPVSLGRRANRARSRARSGVLARRCRGADGDAGAERKVRAVDPRTSGWRRRGGAQGSSGRSEDERMATPRRSARFERSIRGRADGGRSPPRTRSGLRPADSGRQWMLWQPKQVDNVPRPVPPHCTLACARWHATVPQVLVSGS